MRKFIILGAIVAISAPALAKDDPEAPPKVYADLAACRSLEDAAKRLSCFDTAAAAMEQAREAREIVMLDRLAVRKAKKSLFGFSVPDIPLLEGGDEEDEEEDITQITANLDTVREIGYGKWQFTIVDGGTWQSTEPLTSILKPGQSVTIKKGIAGGYMLKIGNGPLRRVKRVD